MKNYRLLLSLCFVLFCLAASGQGILFSEHRMILKEKQISTLQVCNPTDVTRTYQLSAVNKAMDRTGRMTDIPDTAGFANSLNAYVRIFPKRITLEPGGCQEVQLQIKPPAGLAEGEYRSYLHFLPLTSDGGNNAASQQAQGMGTKIIFRVGAAIPLIFRKHAVLSSVRIDSLALTPGRDTAHWLKFTVHRSGSQSIYGDFIVEGMANGKPVLLLNKQGIAVYAEMPARKMELPVALAKLDRDAAGRVKIKVSCVDAENRQSRQPKTLCSTEEWVAVKDR